MLVRKGCQSLPSNMMETSIDEGLETEGEAEEDPSQAFDAFQSTRCGQRRHTLSEVTNQLVVMPGSGMSARQHWVKASQQQLIFQSPKNSNDASQFLKYSERFILYRPHSAGCRLRPARQLREMKYL